MREQDHQQMAGLDCRLQEPPAQEDEGRGYAIKLPVTREGWLYRGTHGTDMLMNGWIDMHIGMGGKRD